MQTSVIWNDQVPERDGLKCPINDIAISRGIPMRILSIMLYFSLLFSVLISDGSRVIVAVGNRVLLYNADTGDLIESLRGLISTSSISIHQYSFSRA